MITKKILRGGVVTLRQIELEDCNENYVKWLNDPEVNQYLETRWIRQNLEEIKEFVIFQRENDHSILFAIIYNPTNQHIGNIKIGPINPHYKYAAISYFIGEKRLWGKGCATEAIRLISEFGFRELGLHRIEAGAYEEAIGSQSALEKNGFNKEAVFRDKAILHGKYIDVFEYSLIPSLDNFDDSS